MVVLGGEALSYERGTAVLSINPRNTFMQTFEGVQRNLIPTPLSLKPWTLIPETLLPNPCNPIPSTLRTLEPRGSHGSHGTASKL